MRDTRLKLHRAAIVWHQQPLQQQMRKAEDDKSKSKGDPDDDDEKDKGDPDDDDDLDPDDEKDKSKDDDDDNGDKPKGKPKDYRALARQKDGELKAEKRRTKAILRAAGVKFDDDESPDELQKRVEKVEAERRDDKIENAVLRACPRDVDVDDLTDSRSFMAKVGDLDPADDDFRDEVKKLVKAEVKRRGLGDDGDGDGDKTRKRSSTSKRDEQDDKRQLTLAEVNKMSPAAVEKARVDGRLRDLLAGKA